MTNCYPEGVFKASSRRYGKQEIVGKVLITIKTLEQLRGTKHLKDTKYHLSYQILQPIS